MEIGVDCVDIMRFQDIGKDKAFLKKIFTPREIKYCLKNRPFTQHFAVRFAGKEAVVKALSAYNVTLPFSEIEIIHRLHNMPQVRLPSYVAGRFSCKISLSHSDTVAVAFVIIVEK